jgi:hypothetical protein
MTEKILKDGDEIKLEEYHRRKWLEYTKLISVLDFLHNDYLTYLERSQKAKVEFWDSVREGEKIAKDSTLEIDPLNFTVKVRKLKKIKKEV